MFKANAKCTFILCLAAASPLLPACISFGGIGELEVATDPFQGPVRSFDLYTSDYSGSELQVKQAGGALTMMVKVRQSGMAGAVVKEGEPTEFAVGGEVLTLANAVEAQPVSNVYGNSVSTRWDLTFKPDRETSARLARAPLNAIKVHLGGRDITLEFSPTKAAKFQSNMVILTSSGGPAPATTPAVAVPATAKPSTTS